MNYTVTVLGCHDDTKVTVDLTAEQAAVVADVAEVINLNAFGCQPCLHIEKPPGMVVDSPARQEVGA